METWQTREIEIYTQKRLKEEFKSLGETKFGIYTTARDIVLSEIAPEIKATEPFLTDHGPTHIADVLDNVQALIGEDRKNLTSLELYCLILSVLFHDVGNIFDRIEHRKTAAKVFEYVWPYTERRLEEYRLLNEIIKAHCGITRNGSKDTIKNVEGVDQLEGKKIRLRQIAAIVRFADELAEGQHRTSLFVQEQFGLPPHSEIYHKYANITKIMIDRGNNRVALSYTICLKNTKGGLTDDKKNELRTLLDYVYKRIITLNQERQYAKFYSEYLPFDETSVSLNFQIGPYPDVLDLPRLYLNDLVVPGDTAKDIQEYDSTYGLDNIMSLIDEEFGNRCDND